MKKTLLFILAAAVLFSGFTVFAPAEAAASGAGLDNFNYSRDYYPGRFADVHETDWYSVYIEGAYNFGFLPVPDEDLFDPGGPMTLGDSVAAAALLHSIYNGNDAGFPEADPYYTVYADYAIEEEIIEGYKDYELPATRAQFAEIIYNAFPETEFTAINDIPEYGICDVSPDAVYGAAVYALYRAGILSGIDGYGTFSPYSFITRAEAAVIMYRVADPAVRARFKLPSNIPAEIIYSRCTDAVFMIETFYENGRSIRTGSGFFISNTGLAAIVLHVFDNAVSAKVTLTNGEVYNVRGLNALSYEHNVAIFSIDSDRTDFSYLRLADSDLIETGNNVYALGSPRALLNTITEGIISKVPRENDYETMLQFTAPISFGSGGSPVLNTLGQVIGLASSSYTYAQNLNLAVCVNHLKNLEPTSRLIALKNIYS